MQLVSLKEIDNKGTDWIHLDGWDDEGNNARISFTLDENTDSEPRGVKVEISQYGTDGNLVTKEATLWQNPQAAAMSLDPTELAWCETSLCVPVTKTVTVYYENAFDQTAYNADYVWLDLYNLGNDFYSDITVEPEAIAVDESGFGTATFSLSNGQGYLYGSQEDVTLVFKGNFYDEDSKTINLEYAEGNNLTGWNLIGNPYGETADLPSGLSYYTLNGDGSELMAGNATLNLDAAPGVYMMRLVNGEKVMVQKIVVR